MYYVPREFFPVLSTFLVPSVSSASFTELDFFDSKPCMRDGKTKHCFSVRAKYRLAALGRAGGAGRGKLNNPERENRHLVCCVCVTRCTEPVEDCSSQGAAEVSHVVKKPPKNCISRKWYIVLWQWQDCTVEKRWSEQLNITLGTHTKSKRTVKVDATQAQTFCFWYGWGSKKSSYRFLLAGNTQVIHHTPVCIWGFV